MRVHRDGLNTLMSLSQVLMTPALTSALQRSGVIVHRLWCHQPHHRHGDGLSWTTSHPDSLSLTDQSPLPSIPWDEEKPWPADYSQESNVSPLHYSSLQCHMILQKSENEDSLLKKQKILLLWMLSSPWWIESPPKKMWIFCNIINVFSDQFNASLLNKSINFYWMVVYGTAF